MTLSEYKKTFIGLLGTIFALPIISTIFDHHSGVPFPPMGDDSGPWRFFAMAIVGSSAFVAYFLSHRKWKGWIIGSLFVLFVLASVAYLELEGEYVLSITFPNGAVRYVTRGTARNPGLKEPYASMDDYDLIRNSGQSDSRLEKIYTKDSLHANRHKLFYSYVLSLVLLEGLVGLIARGVPSKAEEFPA